MKADADSTVVPVAMEAEDAPASAGAPRLEVADVPAAIAEPGLDLALAGVAPEALVARGAPVLALPDFVGTRPKLLPEAADAAPAGMTVGTALPNL